MKKILVVSYFPPEENGSMALWTKDKISSLNYLGYSVHLLTSPISVNSSTLVKKAYRIHSINPSVFLREFKSGKHKRGFLFLPVILSFGLIHEIIERFVLRRIGDGMWGWTLPTFFFIAVLNFKHKFDIILSLGGPTSSHLATALTSNVFGVPSVIEFQDPIVGNDIGHNFRSARYFRLLETFLVSSRLRLIFVTKQAALECQKRNPKANNIGSIYTSSSKLNLIRNSKIETNEARTSLQIAYFGEVYSSRNYDSFFFALKKIFRTGLNFDLSHYGSNPKLNLITMNGYLNFIVKEILSRDAAMREALEYDLLLLIQHTDDRSKITIPYKTWDYLNLQKPILALLNNDELKELLDGLGHYTCDVNNVDSIVNAILRFLDDYKNNKIHIKPNPYDINKQVMELISL